MVRTVAALSLLFCLPLLANAAVVGKKRIEPELDPKSDKKFFGPPFPADYPSDMRPGGKAQFNYPFPHVQHSAQYDEDFVKDENRDNGEWKAQSDYDRLKSKLHEQQMQADAAKQKEDQEKAEADAAKSRKDKAESDAQAAGLNHEKLKELQQKVENKIKNMEDCKQQLEDAQKELEEYSKTAMETGNLDAVEKEKEDAAAGLKAEEDEEVKALKSYEEEKQDVKEAEAALKAAESRLRAIRRGPTPAPPPPPPPPPPSAASRTDGVSLAIVVTLLLAFAPTLA